MGVCTGWVKVQTKNHYFTTNPENPPVVWPLVWLTGVFRACSPVTLPKFGVNIGAWRFSVYIYCAQHNDKFPMDRYADLFLRTQERLWWYLKDWKMLERFGLHLQKNKRILVVRLQNAAYYQIACPFPPPSTGAVYTTKHSAEQRQKNRALLI